MQTLTTTSPNRTVPRKLFYRINEVSKMTGLKPYVLRYWESEFPELSPEKDASDQRRYRSRDIEVILAIRKLLYEDRFTIKGARQRLKAELRKGTPSPEAEAVRAVATAASRVREDLSGATDRQPIGAPAPVASAAPVENIGRTLFHLRHEVGELLKMLGG